MPIANVLDLYHGDNNDRPINWVSVVNVGFIKAVFHKVSQGTSYVDPVFSNRMGAAATIPALKLGGYHFLTNTGSGLDQFNFFINACGKALYDSFIPSTGFQIACDYERSGSTTPTPQIAHDFLCAATDAGYWPWIYGSDLLRETISASTAWRASFSQFKLWLAEYGPHENLPPLWTDPAKTLWQFSENGSIKGITGHVDLNYCPGDLLTLWTNIPDTATAKVMGLKSPAPLIHHPIVDDLNVIVDDLNAVIKKYS